jgi:CRP-like cAMP-binding protein
MRNAPAAHASRHTGVAPALAAAAIAGKEVTPNESALQSIGTVVRFARNATVFSENDKAHYSYTVIKGALRLSKVMLDGRRQIAKFLLPGDMFALDCDCEYALTAEALTEVMLLRYSRAHLERLSDDVPEVRRAVMSSLRRELSAAQKHLVVLGRQTAKERVASFLLLLASRGNRKNREPVEFPMSRQDIADYLGLTVETVCRALTDLKKLGVIAAPDRHQVIICNLADLESIARGGE